MASSTCSAKRAQIWNMLLEKAHERIYLSSKMSAKYDSSTKAKHDDPSEPANKRARKDQTDIADKVGDIFSSVVLELFPHETHPCSRLLISLDASSLYLQSAAARQPPEGM